jgi:hypothetical protein
MFRKATVPSTPSSLNHGALKGPLKLSKGGYDSGTLKKEISEKMLQLPVLGRLTSSNLEAGLKVWVTDPKLLWTLGEIQTVNKEEQIVQVYVPGASEEKIQVRKNTFYKLGLSNRNLFGF